MGLGKRVTLVYFRQKGRKTCYLGKHSEGKEEDRRI